jgi:predicted HicB family RNase H-like nuclease
MWSTTLDSLVPWTQSLDTLEVNMTADTRETIEIDIEQELLYQIMLLAHEQDITLNQMIERILREYIARLEIK